MNHRDGARSRITAGTVLPRHTEQHLASRCENVGPDRCRDFRALPVMDRFPTHDMLVADAAGNLWVRDYPRPGAEKPDRWHVFDGEGRLIAIAEMPRGLHVLDTGDDWLLGLLTDELGVETIELRRVRKG